MSEFAFGAFFVMLIAIPFWGAELSFIRSVYKILKYRPKGKTKLCYIISSVTAFSAIAFLIVSISFKLFDTGSNLTATVLLVAEWTAFILSFVLGSIPIKQ